MTWIVVDVEGDGPAPGLGSMVCFGAVVVEPGLSRTFYGQTAPITDIFVETSLAISGFTRRQHEAFPWPLETMVAFSAWLRSISTDRLTFVSDNPAYDWQWINYYLHRFTDRNPFGFSARRIGDLYAGWKGDAGKSNDWKRMRETAHSHNPVDDARGNAEALLKMRDAGLKIDAIPV